MIIGEGFGPGGSRDRPSDRLKDVYNQGYTSGSDSRSNGPINPNTGSITDQNTGTHFTNGRGPSSSPSSTLGSDSFLNRPESNGHQNGKGNKAPSILATRRPFYNGSGPGKLIDATNGDANSHTHGNSHGTHTSTSDGGPSGRQPQRHHGSGSHTSSSDNLPTGKQENQPIRSGTYDTSGNGHGSHGGNGRSDIDRHQTGNGLRPYDQTRNRNPPFGKETSNTFDQTHGRTPTDVENSGNGNPSTGPQTTDVLSGFRNVFKLPPGLCLVKCESLRPGQALTSDQIRDAFTSSGLNGKPQNTALR